MKPILGRSDYFDFPELRLVDVPVKIDSGAYMSTLHCVDAIVVDDDCLRFRLSPHRAYEFSTRVYETKKFTIKEITSSNGDSEQRYVVSTSIRIFAEDVETTFTLADRSTMNTPVLIGRLALEHYLLDVTKTNQSFQHKYDFK